ncbi:MAG: DUF2846 domain-containing protein [Pseudomonadota bacterium]
MHRTLTALLALPLMLGACASGEEFASIEATIPPAAPEASRVFFYRDQLIGAAVQPTIFVDQNAVGSCEPDGVFYVDLPPGRYVASVTTEVTRELTLELEAGSETFVRCYVSLGILIGRAYLSPMGPIEARKDIAELAFTGAVPSPVPFPPPELQPEPQPERQPGPEAVPAPLADPLPAAGS